MVRNACKVENFKISRKKFPNIQRIISKRSWERFQRTEKTGIKLRIIERKIDESSKITWLSRSLLERWPSQILRERAPAVLQSTPDNSNLLGKSKKCSSYQKFEANNRK